MLDLCIAKAKDLDENSAICECLTTRDCSFVQTIFIGSDNYAFMLNCDDQENLSRPILGIGNKWAGKQFDPGNVEQSFTQAQNLLVSSGHELDWNIVTLQLVEKYAGLEHPDYLISSNTGYVFEWFSEDKSIAVDTTENALFYYNT